MRLLTSIFLFDVILIMFIIPVRQNLGECNPITNSNFNEHIREFSLKEDNNTAQVKTLQEEVKRYADTSSFRPMSFKDVPDSKHSSSSYSSSSYSRGFAHKGHLGYAPHDYEEYPHVGYEYDYHVPSIDHQVHELDHYGHHYSHEGHHSAGHHYKHYNHALAAKAILWPIAGIALLGAAAALVNNPILLQLGVASGKRKRRDTEEVTGPDLDVFVTKWNIESKENHDRASPEINNINMHRKLSQRKVLSNKIFESKQRLLKTSPTTQSPIEEFHVYAPVSMEADDKYIPVPISVKHV